MKKRVVVIHTFLYTVQNFIDLFNEIIPEVEMVNIIDDSLLKEVLANDGPTPNVIRRMCAYAMQAEAMGADAILNACSSVGEVADVAQKMLAIPYLKVDGPMAEIAVNAGNKVGVVATAHSTIGPSSRLVERTAERLGKDVVVNRCYADGAYDALLKEGNKPKHDEILMQTIDDACANNDVVILAQGSMMSLLEKTKDKPVPVICSMRTGVEQIKNVLTL
jgi:aspartate/glutamate racemase